MKLAKPVDPEVVKKLLQRLEDLISKYKTMKNPKSAKA
jgi:hypothetical protein